MPANRAVGDGAHARFVAAIIKSGCVVGYTAAGVALDRGRVGKHPLEGSTEEGLKLPGPNDGVG